MQYKYLNVHLHTFCQTVRQSEFPSIYDYVLLVLG